MSALQNSGVKQPDAKGEHHLQTRQRLPNEEAAQKPERVKSETPPKQTRDGYEQIAQGRQILHQGWWVLAAPLTALFLTVLAFNLLGEGLRRSLDPVMRR